jgi:UPF0755 protein
MSLIKKFVAFVTLMVLLGVAVLGGGAWWWINHPLSLPAPSLDVTLHPNSSVHSVARQLNQAGIPVRPRLFVTMARVLSLPGSLKAGSYEFRNGITPYQLLQKLTLSDTNEATATVPDGWSFRRMRATLDQQPALVHDSLGMSDGDLLRAIGASPEEIARDNAEGLFSPNAYMFDKGSSDLDVYRRAYRLMHQQLDEVWQTRAPDLPYQTAYQALTMASLIEKETASAHDRAMVASVFVNRLRRDMPLQTDPTVIYGLGAAYAGHLSRADLMDDTPYNTYTRHGLPPTPIALPGVASLQAAVHPAQSNALYFVARPDGSSAFSDTLDAHHVAVQHYLGASQ